MKLFYVGREKAVHTAVGSRKYHFTADAQFAAEVPEADALQLLRTGLYMPGGTEAAKQARVRAARILASRKPAEKSTTARPRTTEVTEGTENGKAIADRGSRIAD
jgi:hypothetical protein